MHTNESGRPKAAKARYARALAIYRETSRDAWESVLPHLAHVDAAIIQYIGAHRGATSDECEVALGMTHQTVSAQIRHLYEAGLLVTIGDKRPTRSGRGALVWRLPPRAA